MIRRLTLSVLPLALAMQNAAAQERPVRWTLQRADAAAGAQDTPAVSGEVVPVVLRAELDRGWYLYAQDQPAGGPSSLVIELGRGAFELAGPIAAPKPRTYADRNFDLFTEIYREASTFVLPVRSPPGAHGEQDLVVLVTYQTCNDRYCLPARTDTARLGVLLAAGRDAPPATVARAPARDLAASPVDPAPATGAAARTATDTDAADAGDRTDAAGPAGADRDAAAAVAAAEPANEPIRRGATLWTGTDASLARFLWLAALMGALSLLTPCVFPMVPITVGFFANRGGRGPARAAAFAYGVGIVATFSVLGLLVSVLFGAGGVVRLAANPWLNLAVAALFIAFALNLLGVFELRLPQRLVARAAAAGSGRSDAPAALLMGGAFTVTSFTCTAPFVGTLLVLAAQGGWRWPLLGLTVYATTFALPFVLLALMPDRLARLPRSGPWLTTMKATLGVVELAAAVKFISNADLVWHWGVFTRTVVIACWIVAAAALALLFLRGTRHRRAPRLAAAAASLLIAVWLGTGLRGYRLGELEAFLPPAPEGVLLARAGSGELPWRLNDYDGSLRAARSAGRPVILDFTGYTCTNCRWMEANMFPRPEVRALLGEYVRVRLYTDGRGAMYQQHQRLQEQLYGTVALPYYAVLAPDGRTVATFLGMTRDTREFVRFLTDGMTARPADSTP